MTNSQTHRQPVCLNIDDSNACLANGCVTGRVDLKSAHYSIADAKSNERLLADASLGVPRSATADLKVESQDDVETAIGRGKRLILSAADPEWWRYNAHHTAGKPLVTRLFSMTLYEDHPALFLGFGIRMPEYFSMRLMSETPLCGGLLFGGRSIQNPFTLNGAAGAEPTQVLPALSRQSLNSLMLTGLVDGHRRTAVWGGLQNQDFAKVATLFDGKITLRAEDPIGRLVDEGQTYWPQDTFYLDVHTSEPFDAIEQYGWAMRLANKANPSVYDFPVLCGWSVGHVSKLPDINNSAKLVDQLDSACTAGLTRYTRVAIRLEPDKYHNDTEQGWWDDEHFRKFGHLVEPYDTIAAWCLAIQERRGVPYIYMQLGMPSDDYARAFPQHMLFNDASEVDRVNPNMKSRNGDIKHPHHQPYVTYDYTDADFGRHIVETWARLRKEGIRGVKIDYPESAWRPEGGFDDRHASTTSAYRRAFELIREGMGEDGLIDERNLGESARPCLDVTAGIIDTQRTWIDSNAFVPQMISISGLRWYKNRTVFNYYSDTKAVHDLPQGVLHALLTMNFLTSGRLDLSTSFSLFTPEITHAVSRTYPHYREPNTARPLDAFTGIKDPQVYDLELTADWHQLALFNTGEEQAVISTAISGDRVDNALGLDPSAHYHAYEFWTDRYLGNHPGTARVEYKLAPLHCAMISLRKVQPHPQVVSTSRHVLQGWVDLTEVRWDDQTKTLSGVAHVIGGEPFTIIIAQNGTELTQAAADDAKITAQPDPHAAGLISLTLTADGNRPVRWTFSAYHDNAG